MTAVRWVGWKQYGDCISVCELDLLGSEAALKAPGRPWGLGEREARRRLRPLHGGSLQQQEPAIPAAEAEDPMTVSGSRAGGQAASQRLEMPSSTPGGRVTGDGESLENTAPTVMIRPGGARRGLV